MSQMTQKGSDEKFCSDCGNVIKQRAEICPHCGVRQIPAYGGSSNVGVTAPNGKNKIAAALLALCLGGFGVHKFYLGETGMGILYLVFFWTVIPALIAIVEFVLLLTMTDDAFLHKYGGV